MKNDVNSFISKSYFIVVGRAFESPRPDPKAFLEGPRRPKARFSLDELFKAQKSPIFEQFLLNKARKPARPDQTF